MEKITHHWLCRLQRPGDCILFAFSNHFTEKRGKAVMDEWITSMFVQQSGWGEPWRKLERDETHQAETCDRSTQLKWKSWVMRYRCELEFGAAQPTFFKYQLLVYFQFSSPQRTVVLFSFSTTTQHIFLILAFLLHTGLYNCLSTSGKCDRERSVITEVFVRDFISLISFLKWFDLHYPAALSK